ncbi:NAD(P)-binding protein [Calocera cornea HHB12733]|uniref:NAD(P)-binding protein n=1 Tax=Calocera cornea HHB12733 TaxID=1353952 RepID=A0A165F1Q2_9BASI|nr:NAD(P)-binding protein [Calocera cornea HHB12733]
MQDQKPVVLITGCSAGGIGYALCEAWSPHASTVYATSRRLSSMSPFPTGNIKVLELDVSSEESVVAAVEEVLRAEGRVDVAVSNAGGMSVGPILDADLQEIQRSFDTNVFGMHRLARAVIPGMIERKHGLFVVVSSITALVPGPWHGIYSAGKAALLNYAETLDMECRPLGVRVQTLIPGAVRSRISTNEMLRWPGLSPTSPWAPWESAVRARITFSQQEGVSMDTREFADRAVVGMRRKWGWRALGARVLGGGGSLIYWVLSCLPRSWALAVVWWNQGGTLEVKRA